MRNNYKDNPSDVNAGRYSVPGERQTGLLVPIKLLDPNAQIPTYGTVGAACFDFVACECVSIDVGESRSVKIGVSMEVPKGHVLLMYSRSGHGFKHGIRLCNSVGVIDSDYRGEIGVKLVNEGDQPFFVAIGDRVAQGMIIPIPFVQFYKTDELSETERASGGFGSTGR